MEGRGFFSTLSRILPVTKKMSSSSASTTLSSSSFPRRSTSALEAVIDAALLLDPHDSMEYAVQITHQEQLQQEILLQQQQQLRRHLQQQRGGSSSASGGGGGEDEDEEAMPINESDTHMLFQYAYKPTGIRGNRKPKRERSPQKESKHGRWSSEEDIRLSEIIPRLGTQSWVDIAKELVDAMKTHHGQDPKGPQRTCKQCRQRWTNFLDPTVRRAHWTKEEDDKILEMVKLYGHKWSDISRQLNGRSEALVKNRWYSSVRKLAGINPGDLMAGAAEEAYQYGEMFAGQEEELLQEDEEEGEEEGDEEEVEEEVVVPVRRGRSKRRA